MLDTLLGIWVGGVLVMAQQSAIECIDGEQDPNPARELFVVALWPVWWTAAVLGLWRRSGD